MSDEIVDLCGKILLCSFYGTIALLCPVWGWWMFRLYFPKHKDK